MEWLAAELTPLDDLVALIEAAIDEDAPLQITESNIIKDGFHQQLDEYRTAMRNGKQWLAELEANERQATGVKTWKLGSTASWLLHWDHEANLVNLDTSRYERKQTLAMRNGLFHPSWKTGDFDFSRREIGGFEYRLFLTSVKKWKEYHPSTKASQSRQCTVDVLQSFRHSFGTLPIRAADSKKNERYRSSTAVIL